MRGNHNDVAGQLKRLRVHDLTVYQQRIQADIDASILPAGADAAYLARYTGALLQGISQSTRDGASQEELERVAELAMQAWPPSSGRQPAR